MFGTVYNLFLICNRIMEPPLWSLQIKLKFSRTNSSLMDGVCPRYSISYSMTSSSCPNPTGNNSNTLSLSIKLRKSIKFHQMPPNSYFASDKLCPIFSPGKYSNICILFLIIAQYSTESMCLTLHQILGKLLELLEENLNKRKPGSREADRFLVTARQVKRFTLSSRNVKRDKKGTRIWNSYRKVKRSVLGSWG